VQLAVDLFWCRGNSLLCPLLTMATMNASNPSFGRRSIRLKQYDYTAAGAYFLTVCGGEGAITFGSLSEG